MMDHIALVRNFCPTMYAYTLLATGMVFLLVQKIETWVGLVQS